MADRAVTKKSATGDDWCTPRPVIDAVYAFNRGQPPILDPCSNAASIVNAMFEWFGPPTGTDGLATPWPRRGLVYTNPPYSAKAIWMRKCADEARQGSEIIALVPADTDTGYFHEYTLSARAICFWRGRMKFGGDVAYGARFPSMLPYWGPRVDAFCRVFTSFGWCPQIGAAQLLRS